jgi:hypothetical protein
MNTTRETWPKETWPKETWLVVNASSGSNSEAAVKDVVAALTGAGHAPARIIDILSAGVPRMKDMPRAGLLAVFAGDGTVSSVVAGAQGWDGAVLVLPGGTANLLARALHGDADAAEIASQVESLTPANRGCIQTSKGIGLIEVLAGPGASWSQVREGLRERQPADIAGSTIEAVKESTGGPMVLLDEPAGVGREEGYAGLRLVPADGKLAVSGYGPRGIGDTLRQGLALIRGDFRDGPHDELGLHPRVVCRSADGSPIELTGEAAETFLLAPLAVNLLSLRHG